MSANPLDAAPATLLAPLITFGWGKSAHRAWTHYANYCRWTSDITEPTSGDAFTAEPSIQISAGEQQGGVEDAPYTITMRPVPPLDEMLGHAHAEVTVWVSECDPRDVAGTYRKAFMGTVRRVTRNPQGLTGLVRFEVAGHRYRLPVPLGILVDAQCNWAFGDRQCQVSLAPIRQVGTVTAIAGRVITVSGISSAVARYWLFGYATLENLNLAVVEYATGTALTLARVPPASWLGASVTFTPGCDKSLKTCRNRWHNEVHFGGLGVAIPAYNPQLEDPG